MCSIIDKVYIVASEDTGYVVGAYTSKKRAYKARDSYKAWCLRMFGKHRNITINVTEHIVDTRE